MPNDDCLLMMSSRSTSPTQEPETGWPEPRAVYVHVPFCIHRCGYCDFTVIAGRDDLIPRYLAALRKEVLRVDGPREVDTVFIGGGTPTYLGPEELDELFAIIAARFRPAAGAEITVEANPEGLDDRRLEVLRRRGVNRLSLGVQAMQVSHLRTLERSHTPEDVAELIARGGIENLSIDLIFGIPGQTLDEWRASLSQVIALRPQHISAYGLTFEKGTQFWNRRRTGELVAVPEELEREMYGMAMDVLPKSGYRQYEISNFAVPGFESRHNSVYWAGEQYWGFGPGAARYLRGERAVNHRSVTAWLKRMESGETPIAEAEVLPLEERARELVMLGLRRVAGIMRREFQEKTGLTLDGEFAETMRRFCESGLLSDDGERMALTREGRFVADYVISAFLSS